MTTKICYLAVTIADEEKIDIYLNTKLWLEKNAFVLQEDVYLQKDFCCQQTKKFYTWCVLLRRKLVSEEGTCMTG